VRYWAIAALSGAHDGRATAPLIELSRQKRSRERAVWALGRLGDASALPVLIEALADRSKEVRMTAARALGVLGDHRGAGPLIELLRDPDRDLRAAAVFGLGHLGDERAIEPLLDLARREVDVPLSPADSAVQAAAACGEAGREAVLRATADAHPGIRSYAASTFKRPYGQELDEERVLVALVRLLHDPRAAIGATDALLSATGRRVVELVLPLFSNTDPGVRKNAIRAIWGHADADAITRTIELLETDQDPTVRATAAWGLGVSKQPQSQEPLRHAAEGDRDPAVRGTSLRSLARIARHDRGSPHDSGGAAFNSSTSATVRHTCT
jgi:HEAT repeat protein